MAAPNRRTPPRRSRGSDDGRHRRSGGYRPRGGQAGGHVGRGSRIGGLHCSDRRGSDAAGDEDPSPASGPPHAGHYLRIDRGCAGSGRCVLSGVEAGRCPDPGSSGRGGDRHLHPEPQGGVGPNAGGPGNGTRLAGYEAWCWMAKHSPRTRRDYPDVSSRP